MAFDVFDGDLDIDELTVGLGIGEEVGRENAEDEKKTKKASENYFEIDPNEGFDAKTDSTEAVGMSAQIKGERPKGAISLKAKKKSKLPPFEQWVSDVITGKKDLDDEL